MAAILYAILNISKMLNDDRVSPLWFFKHDACTTRIHKEKKLYTSLPGQTDFLPDYISTFIKNQIFAFSPKFLSKPWFWTQNLKGRCFWIKSPTKDFVFLLWLTNDSNLKFLQVEIISLWIKTIANFNQFLKSYLR